MGKKGTVILPIAMMAILAAGSAGIVPKALGSPTDSSQTQVFEGGVKLNVIGGAKFASSASIGDSKQITATITNADAMDKRIRWESSDPSKVSVGQAITQSGEPNTIKLESDFEGTVTIKAWAALASDYWASATVTREAEDGELAWLEFRGYLVGTEQPIDDLALLQSFESPDMQEMLKALAGGLEGLQPLEIGGVLFDNGPYENDRLALSCLKDDVTDALYAQLKEPDAFDYGESVWMVYEAERNEPLEDWDEDDRGLAQAIDGFSSDCFDIGDSLGFYSVANGYHQIFFIRVSLSTMEPGEVYGLIWTYGGIAKLLGAVMLTP